jgi:uncharacterized protein (TIGR02145 family)
MRKKIKLLIVSLALIISATFGKNVKAQENETYTTVKIVNQEWMAENLNVSHFRNGDLIPEARTDDEWINAIEEKQPAWCYYEYDPANGKNYGKLYNWFAVNDPRGLAPEGWHVASDHEWKILEMALGMSQDHANSKDEWRGTDEGDKLKAKHGWEEKGNGTDESGFSALPGGLRMKGNNFGYMGSEAYFWTSTYYLYINVEYEYLPFNVEYEYLPISTTIILRILSSDKSEIGRSNYFKNIGASVRCLKDPEVTTLPIVTTLKPSSISETSAEVYGYVNMDGGSDITEKGIYWSTSSDSETSGTKLPIETNTILHYATLQGLTASTTYYLKAYAINNEGESLGEEVSFTTDAPDCTPDDIFSDGSGFDQIETGTFTDTRDGMEYYWVKIGNQIWMAENLNTSYFRNGEPIPEGESEEDWENLKYIEEDDFYTDAGNSLWCYNSNDPSNGEKYGKLYNWYAADNHRGLCPEGWHIPSDEEWMELEMFLGMSQSDVESKGEWRGTDEGGRLKANCGWAKRGFGTNSSGFSALPGGFRDDDGEFSGIGNNACFWSSSQEIYEHVHYRELGSTNSAILRDYRSEKYGFSVRCIRYPL